MNSFYISILLLVVGNLQIMHAQDLGPFLMGNDQLHLDRNPAMPYPKKNNLGLVEFKGQFDTESGTLDEWSFKNPDGSRSIGLQSIWKGLERKDYTSEGGFSVRTFSFGKKFESWQFKVAHEIKGDVNFTYNKDLVGLLAYGNYGLLQVEPLAKTQSLDIAPYFGSTIYQSFGIESAYFINDRWSLGFGAAYLAGISQVESDFKRFELDIHDPLTVKASEDWTIRTADLIQSISIDSFDINYDDQVLGKHPGTSFSLGIFHQTEKWQLGLQVRDLGWISWDGRTHSRKIETNYSGIQVNDFLNLDAGIFDHIRDTLRSLTHVQESDIRYRTGLQSKIILDGQYHWSDKWTAGGAIYIRQNTPDTYWRAMAGIVFKPSEILQLGGDLAYDSYQQVSVGLFGALKLSIFNLFMSLDHVPILFDAGSSHQFGGSMGINLLWGK